MKKITLFLMICIGWQSVKAQDSCASPVAINAAGLYVVGPINGELPLLVCAQNGTGATAGEWYAYTPAEDHNVTVTTYIAENNPLVDTRIHVYTGTCDALQCYAGDDDSGANYSSVASFNVYGGTTYLIAFDNKWNGSGFTFQLIENPFIVVPPAPVNFVSQTIPGISGGYTNCAVDMNGDYLDDLVSASPANINIQYQNADGTFTTANIATSGVLHDPGWSIAAGDFNKDGYNDLMYGSGDGLTLMSSNSTGTAYTPYNPGQYIFCQRTNFVDINNDGNLDAFSCHDIAPNCYYINNGSGSFTYHQSSVGSPADFGSVGGNYATLWFDYDNDGDEDVFVSKCSGPPCELHRNNGNGTWTDVSAVAGINLTPIESWSSAIADFDNDGDMDIMIGSNGSVGNKLYRNDLDTTNATEEPFTEVTIGSGLENAGTTNRDYIAYDFDNDGLIDIMGGGGKIMFNQGNMTFAPASYMTMYLGPVGDFNNDGFLDIQNGSVIWKNAGNGNKWLGVQLKGIESNSNGIGARVEIYGAWGKQIRDVRSGEGFEYMSSLNVHFGIGAASAIDKVVIRWPSGIIDTILNPSSNQYLFVTEGSTLAINDFTAAGFTVYPNPADDVLKINMGSAENSAIVSARIFDLNGRLVLSSDVSNQNIQVKALSPGTYILILKDSKGKQFNQKFLKK